MINNVNFTSKIDSYNVSIYGLDHKFPKVKGLQNGSDYEIEPHNFAVKWNLEMESREWGIKSFWYYVTDVSGSYSIIYFDEKGDYKDSEQVEFEFEPFADGCEMERDLTTGSIAFEDIEIDYASMSVSVK